MSEFNFTFQADKDVAHEIFAKMGTARKKPTKLSELFGIDPYVIVTEGTIHDQIGRLSILVLACHVVPDPEDGLPCEFPKVAR